MSPPRPAAGQESCTAGFFFIYVSNEPKSVLARDLGGRRKTMRNSQSVFLIVSWERKRGFAMFREMRRKRQLLPEKECIRILEQETSGVLSVLGDEDYPYAVPLSYVYSGNTLYFHCAKNGHKLDAIRKHSKASFCVIAQDHIVPEEYTTYFKSVIVFGRAHILTDSEKIQEAIELLSLKYNPSDSAKNRQTTIDRESAALCMFALEVEFMTGKEAIELVKRTENDLQ